MLNIQIRASIIHQEQDQEYFIFLRKMNQSKHMKQNKLAAEFNALNTWEKNIKRQKW